MPLAVRKKVKPEVTESPALSLMARPGNGAVQARKVAVLIADGVDDDVVRAIAEALQGAGAVPRLVGSKLGAVQATGGELEVDATVETTPSVLYDAVVVAGDGDVARTLTADGRVLEFLKDQYRHCKPMLVAGDFEALLTAAGIPPELPGGGPDPGLIVAEDATEAISAFITALGKHRHFERETDPPRV
jgi:catalase